MQNVTIEQVKEMARADAIEAYSESGCELTPDGGWDSWLVDGLGVSATLARFGEPESENAEGWSPEMTEKLIAYNAAAIEAIEAIED